MPLKLLMLAYGTHEALEDKVAPDRSTTAFCTKCHLVSWRAWQQWSAVTSSTSCNMELVYIKLLALYKTVDAGQDCGFQASSTTWTPV